MRARIVVTFGLLLLTGLFAVQAAAQPRVAHHVQKHDVRHEIDQMEETWRTAVLNADAGLLAPLLADDYLGISPNGTLQTRDETLEHIRNGHTRFTTLELSERKIRYYGATAVVTSRAEVSGVTSEGPMAGIFRYSRVYVRNERGRWAVVSFEASRIRTAEERRAAHHQDR